MNLGEISRWSSNLTWVRSNQSFQIKNSRNSDLSHYYIKMFNNKLFCLFVSTSSLSRYVLIRPGYTALENSHVWRISQYRRLQKKHKLLSNKFLDICIICFENIHLEVQKYKISEKVPSQTALSRNVRSLLVCLFYVLK